MGTITSDNNFGVAKLIVDNVTGQGNYTTIAAALTAASSGDTIFIRSGTYTENPTLKSGVNLCTFDCDALTPNVNIVGKMTATFTGTVSISGICLSTNSDYIIESTGSSSTILNLENCYLNMTNFSGIHSTNTNFQLNIVKSKGDRATTGIRIVSMSAGTVALRYCTFTNSGGGTTTEDISGGQLFSIFTTLTNGVNCSSTGNINFRYVFFSAPSGVIPLTSTSSSICVLYYCNLTVGGAVECINTTGSGAVRLWGSNIIESTATYAITGTGPVIYDLMTSGNNNSNLDPGLSITSRRIYTGQIDLGGGNVRIQSGSGSPNGSVSAPKGSLFLRTDGSSTSTRAYINTNGGTTWTAITTVA